MKKRMLSFFLVLSLVFATMVAPVQAEAEDCACGCETAPAEIRWTPWEFTEGNAESGHYYLTQDYRSQTDTITIPAFKEVCLDLRGHVYETSGIRMFSLEGKLSIMDSVGTGMILTTGRNDTFGGFAYVSSVGELNIAGGTIQFLEREDIVVPAGGLIYVRSGKLNVTGGTLRGGVIRPDADTNAQGGNIYVNGGSMTMSGGLITEGMARRNPDSTMTAFQGGNLYAVNNAVVEISGGTVSNGYSDQDGGNLYIAGATLEISGDARITGGHAYRNGGNIQQLSTGINRVSISGGTITGGVAGGVVNDYVNQAIARGSGGGGNLYVNSAKGALIISGGTIDGDVTINAIDSLTLSGAPRIGLGKSNGLFLKNSIKADVSGLSGGEIYVYATGVFTKDLTDAAAMLTYFKGAVRTGITVSGNSLKGAQGTQGYCPHCGQLQTWSSGWSTIQNVTADGTHRYIAAPASANRTIGADIVLDLNGYPIYRETRTVTIAAGKSLTVLDSFGGGQIIGTAGLDAATYGGVVMVNGSDASFTLLSGTIRRTAPYTEDNADKASNCYIGGVIYASGASTVTILGGIVRDGIANAAYGETTGSGSMGGNIGFNSVNGNFQMSGGLILGGSAADSQYNGKTVQSMGGNLFTPGTISISGGFLLDGTATLGGNIRANNTMEMTGGTIAYGSAAVNGGNVSARMAASLTGGLLSRGTAGSGGNLFLEANTAGRTISCTLLGGEAALGGNLFLNGNTAVASKATISGATVLSGTAAAGGNLYVTCGTMTIDQGTLVYGGVSDGTTDDDSGGNLLLSGAQVSMDHAKIAGGRTNQRGGNLYALGGTQLTADSVEIAGGSATAYGGNVALGGTATQVSLENSIIEGGSARNAGANVCLLGSPSLTLHNMSVAGEVYGDNGTVTLSGTTCLRGGKHYNLYFKNGKVSLTSDWTGEAGVKWSAVAFTYGDPLPNLYIESQNAPGKLVYDGLETHPGILSSQGELVVATTRLQSKDGTESWYGDNGSAVAAYTSDTEYLQLMTGEDLTLTGGVYLVDLAGQSVTVTGTGILSCIDSANDTYDASACGKLTVDGPTLTDSDQSQLLGNRYIRVEEGGTYTFHRLDMAITNVVLRPSCVGLYYQAAWQCDSVLSSRIVRKGIAVSLTDMPGEDLLTDEDTLWTQGGTSALIQNIFTEEWEQNRIRGEMPIYATAYICMAEGAVYTDETVVDFSLYSFLQTADAAITADRITYREAEKQLKEFYGNWQEKGAGEWTFVNIQTPVAPADDDVTKILMIGQSHAQDTVWLLYDVLKAQMPDEEFLVVDVYRSTNLDEHVQNIRNRAPLYDCYANDSGYVRHTPNVTITDVIMSENWDVIIFTEAAWNQTQPEQYQDGDFDFMIDHIRRYADPGFRLAYNATWAQPVTAQLYAADRRPAPASFRNQFTQYFGGDRLAHFSQISNMMETYVETNEAFDIVFHSGTAIQYASEVHGVPEADPNRVYDLYRDYTHLSEFGRLIVAYQLYAQIYGLEELTEVNVNMIRQDMRATSREQAFGDLVITQQHKDAIIASVNYALKNPNKAPEPVIRDQAILEPLS